MYVAMAISCQIPFSHFLERLSSCFQPCSHLSCKFCYIGCEFQKQQWENVWESGWSAYGLSWALRYHLELGSLLDGVYVPCIYRTPGGVIVGDSGLWCCGPAFNVWRQLFERNYFPLFVDWTEPKQGTARVSAVTRRSCRVVGIHGRLGCPQVKPGTPVTHCQHSPPAGVTLSISIDFQSIPHIFDQTFHIYIYNLYQVLY